MEKVKKNRRTLNRPKRNRSNNDFVEEDVENNILDYIEVKSLFIDEL